MTHATTPDVSAAARSWSRLPYVKPAVDFRQLAALQRAGWIPAGFPRPDARVPDGPQVLTAGDTGTDPDGTRTGGDSTHGVRSPHAPGSADAAGAPRRSDAASREPDLPEEVRRAVSVFTRAIVEGLTGRRSVQQFGDHVAQRVMAVIAARARADRQLPPLAPVSVRVQMPTPLAAEVAVRLVRGDRSIAAAFRLDRRRGSWRCTALVVGP